MHPGGCDLKEARISRVEANHFSFSSQMLLCRPLRINLGLHLYRESLMGHGLWKGPVLKCSLQAACKTKEHFSRTGAEGAGEKKKKGRKNTLAHPNNDEDDGKRRPNYIFFAKQKKNDSLSPDR